MCCGSQQENLLENKERILVAAIDLKFETNEIDGLQSQVRERKNGGGEKDFEKDFTIRHMIGTEQK